MINYFLTEKADRLSVFGQPLVVKRCIRMYISEPPRMAVVPSSNRFACKPALAYKRGFDYLQAIAA